MNEKSEIAITGRCLHRFISALVPPLCVKRSRHSGGTAPSDEDYVIERTTTDRSTPWFQKRSTPERQYLRCAWLAGRVLCGATCPGTRP